MKVFVLILIFCWKTLCEGLTCYDSSGTNIECSESVNFCVYSNSIFRNVIGFNVSCDGNNHCEGYGRFRTYMNGSPSPWTIDYYCCDTDLCNSEQNFNNPPPQRNTEEKENRDAEGNIVTTSEMPGTENFSTSNSDSSKFTTTSYEINTTSESFTTTFVTPSTTDKNFNNAREKLFPFSLIIFTVFVYLF